MLQLLFGLLRLRNSCLQSKQLGVLKRVSRSISSGSGNIGNMDDTSQRRRERNTTTDAGKINQHTLDVQPVPQIILPESKLNIKKSTPEEFDKKSNLYTEKEDLHPDELEYIRDRKDQGIVIIFNQVQFLYEPDKKRSGSTKDVNDIIFTLGRLGYNIEEKYIFSNSTTIEIWNKIDEIGQEDLSDRNSLIVFFLTHGMDKDTLMTKDSEINTRHIWDKLGRHKDLANKPKLFVFQACKGERLSTPFEKEPTEKGFVPKGHAITYVSLSSYDQIPPDVLLCYSSVEGMKSFRHIEKGTWFVQEICRTFLMYGRREDVISLLTRVTKCVSTYTHEKTKQMPVFVSTLSKKYYLCKTKDRLNKLAIYQIYNKIYNTLKDMDSQIDGMERPFDSRK